MSITADEMNTFTRDFSASIDRGESLVRSLADLASRQPNPDLGRVITDIGRDLQTGHTLSTAMGRYTDLFSTDQITVIRQGERVGRLDDALRLLA